MTRKTWCKMRASALFNSSAGSEAGIAAPGCFGSYAISCYTWLQQNRAHELTVSFSEDLHDLPSDVPGPEAVLLRQADDQRLRQAMEELPAEFREVLVLRELEDFSYKEIAGIADIPLGTVMSRLARARKRLEHCMKQNEESYREL